MNPKVITSINESWWAAVSITLEFLLKVEEMHGKPQVSKIGGRLMFLLPTFTTHPTTDAIQGAS
jgi:hypothetical protein